MAKKKKQKKKNTVPKQPSVSRPKEFLDLIAPAAVKFNTDHFILGGTYRSVVALRSYPPTTEELALLRRLGEMAGVTLRLSARRVTTAEEDAIIHAATNKNRMERSNFSTLNRSMLTPNCLIGARPFTFTSGIGPMHPDPAGRALRQSPLISACHAAL